MKIFVAFLALPAATAATLFFALLLQYGWNTLLIPRFTTTPLTYLDAFCFNLFLGILFHPALNAAATVKSDAEDLKNGNEFVRDHYAWVGILRSVGASLFFFAYVWIVSHFK